MLPNYQARSPFVLKHTTSVFIYLYIYMFGRIYQTSQPQNLQILRYKGKNIEIMHEILRLSNSCLCVVHYKFL